MCCSVVAVWVSLSHILVSGYYLVILPQFYSKGIEKGISGATHFILNQETKMRGGQIKSKSSYFSLIAINGAQVSLSNTDTKPNVTRFPHLKACIHFLILYSSYPKKRTHQHSLWLTMNPSDNDWKIKYISLYFEPYSLYSLFLMVGKIEVSSTQFLL